MNLTGKILVASPIMDDDFFKKSILYICSHDSEGAIAVIVNRIIGEIDLKAEIDQKAKQQHKFPLYNGGPVSAEKLIVLAVKKEFAANFDETPIVTVYSEIADFYKLYAQNKLLDNFLIAQGVTSWDNAQFEEEIASNCWLVTNPSMASLFEDKQSAWEKEILALGLTPNSTNLVNYTGQA